MSLSVDWLDLTIFLSLVIFSMAVDHYLHKDDKPVTLKISRKLVGLLGGNFNVICWFLIVASRFKYSITLYFRVCA